MEKENWIKWLQSRIPELKKSHNEYWLSLALDGYFESKQIQALLQPPVVGRNEQLTAFTTWLSENHSIEIHDMILQDYIRYGG
jgi:hypothetical protein